MNSITVIIPVFNCERYLAATIQSALAQTHPPAELIIVDDGSTDDSAAMAQAYTPRVRYLHQANLGPAAARNLGVSQATGDLLAFLDADDLWTPDKLARQMQVLQTDPACEAVLGRIENFISLELDENQRQMLARSAAQTGDFHVGALLIRQGAFRRVGDFDKTLQSGEFIDWWARAVDRRLAYQVLPFIVMHRRLHGQNHTLRRRDTQYDYLRVVKAALNRRRPVE